MASEQQSADLDFVSGETVTDISEEQSKPSFLSKMKAKARRLKSKMTSHGLTDESQDESPRHPLSAGEEDSESDASEAGQGDKYDIPYTPLSSAVLPQPQRPARAIAPKAEGTSVGAVTSGRSAHDTEGVTNTDDQPFPLDRTVLKTEGPSGHEQAVPTNYSYFNSDPVTAQFPSEQDALQPKRGVPSAIGGEFAGLTPAPSTCSNGTQNRFSVRDGSLQKSGGSYSGLPLSFVAQDVDQKSDLEARSIIAQPFEQDRGVRFPEPSSMSALTPRNSLNDSSELTSNAHQQNVLETSLSSNSLTDGYNNDGSYTSSQEGHAVGHGTTGTAEGAKEVMDVNWNTPSEESTWTQTAHGLKNSLASTFGYTGNSAVPNLLSHDGDQKPFMDRVTETAYGLKDVVASTFEYGDQTMSNDALAVSQKATDSAVQVKNLAANAVHSSDQGLSSEEKPVSAIASEETLQSREVGLQNINPGDQDKGLTDSISQSPGGLPSMLSSKLSLGGGSLTFPSPTSAEVTRPGPGFKDGSDAPTAGTPTSNPPYDPSSRKDTPYPDRPSSTPTGLFDRVSDIASSLFGRGPNPPTTERVKSI